MYCEISEDDFFGDQEDREMLEELADASIAYGFSQLSMRRSLQQVMLFDGGASPTLLDIRHEMCMQYFHFEMPELMTMARELKLYGRTFKVRTGRDRQKNWYRVRGDTALLMLLWRLCTPGRQFAMVEFF